MGLRRASFLALLWWMADIVGGGRARAQADGAEPAAHAVVLDARDCAPIEQPALQELVALELAPRPLLAPDQVTPAARPVWARLVCRGTQALLRVEDRERGGHQELTLDLTETVASGQTRLLALAISELVVSLELEAQSSARAAPAPAPAPPPAPPPPPRRPSGPPRSQADLWLAAGLTRAGDPAMLGWSVDVGGQWFLGALPLALEADLSAGRAQRTVEDGQIRNWMLMGSAALVPTLRRPWIEAGLGAGLRLGHAWLEGVPAPNGDALEAGRLNAFWWGPLLLGSVLVPVHARWSVRAMLDLAYVVKPVRGFSASGEVAYALERFVLQASLGVAFGF